MQHINLFVWEYDWPPELCHLWFACHCPFVTVLCVMFLLLLTKVCPLFAHSTTTPPKPLQWLSDFVFFFLRLLFTLPLQKMSIEKIVFSIHLA